jgi:peptidoglycan/xylan/chitin deacetylase (PgdA/CDA1 family)
LPATVSDRWNWDFEDERGRSPTSQDGLTVASRDRDSAPPDHTIAPDAPPEARGGPPYDARVRRRRGVAALLACVVVAAAVAVLVSNYGGHSSAASTARRAVTGAHLARAPMRAREKPEDDQDAAVSSVLAYTPFVKEGGTRGRDIALTFDDGPGPYTPGVLSVLERYRVHATFFVIGKMLRYFSASTAREIRDGDVIGDHTETHPEMALLSAHEQYEELFEQIVRVELLRGRRPVLFRPPYGSFDATTMRQLRRLHLLMTLWSVDTGDYLQPGVSVIVQRVLAGAHPGAIILMHDAGGTRTQTIAALPTIIADLRARGFHLVTVPQLLRDDPPAPGQPLPPNLSGD